MIFKDIIAKKLNRKKLNKAEIDFFVAGITDLSLSEEQIAALAMAISYEGLSFDETCLLTKALARSGACVSWKGIKLDGPLIDIHSARGIGDKTALILAPIMAACGGFSPIISLKGMTSSLGYADKLESIPDYKTNIPLPLFQSTLRNAGCSFMAQTEEIAPADKRLYAIRAATGFFFSFPLIIASILAKKIAGGSQNLLVNMKVGEKALIKSMPEGKEFAAFFTAIAAANNITAKVIFSDSQQIYGRSIGASLEVIEAIEFLKGKLKPSSLDKVISTLGSEMLVLCGLASNKEEAEFKIQWALTSGEAAERFARMIASFSPYNDILENYQRIIPKAPIMRPLFSPRQGYISAVKPFAFEGLLSALGGCRLNPNDNVNRTVGFSGCRIVGDFVSPDTPLLFVHAASEETFNFIENNILNLFSFSDEKPQNPAFIFS